jgi:hypothetical protein
MGRKTSGGKAKQLTDFSHLLETKDTDIKGESVKDIKEPV